MLNMMPLSRHVLSLQTGLCRQFILGTVIPPTTASSPTGHLNSATICTINGELVKAMVESIGFKVESQTNPTTATWASWIVKKVETYKRGEIQSLFVA